MQGVIYVKRFLIVIGITGLIFLQGIYAGNNTSKRTSQNENKITKLFDMEMLDKFEKNKKNSKLYEKFNCFATMVVDNRKYITINGVKDESLTDHPHKQKNGESGLSHLKVAFKELLGKKSTYYVGISDLTRYYTENLEYIIYKEFKENKDLNNLNRMFTCCEKKLFAKLSELSPNDKKITLTITRPPCPLCKRAIEALRKDNKYELIIKCGESELTKEKLDEMDNVAKKILGK